MARKKSGYQNIVSMRLLMELYAMSKSIPPYPEKTSERRYVEALGEALEADGIAKNSSINFINKLRGFPYQNDASQVEGIDTDKLDSIAYEVIKHYKLNEQHKLNIRFPWSSFESLFEIPQYLRTISEKKYFKYLNEEEQDAVDAFVLRKINELTENSYLHNYCMYYWNQFDNKVDVGILQINQLLNTATLKFLYYDGEKWITKTVQRTDKEGGSFVLTNSICYINAIEEDDKKSHLRTSCYLSVQDSDFYSLKLIKGTYATSRKNGIVPVAGLLILDKKKTFQDAFDLATTTVIDSRIQLELQQKRIDVSDNKIRTRKDFWTADLSELLQDVVGLYWFAFIKRMDKSDNGIRKYTRGICFIGESGMYMQQISESKQVIQGHVHTDIYQNNNGICISIVQEKNTDNFKYTYDLEVIREKNQGPVKELVGVYSGMSWGKPRAGMIIFKKITAPYKDFYHLQSEFDFKRIWVGHEPREEKTFLEQLSKRNDYLML